MSQEGRISSESLPRGAPGEEGSRPRPAWARGRCHVTLPLGQLRLTAGDPLSGAARTPGSFSPRSPDHGASRAGDAAAGGVNAWRPEPFPTTSSSDVSGAVAGEVFSTSPRDRHVGRGWSYRPLERWDAPPGPAAGSRVCVGGSMERGSWPSRPRPSDRGVHARKCEPLLVQAPEAPRGPCGAGRRPSEPPLRGAAPGSHGGSRRGQLPHAGCAPHLRGAFAHLRRREASSSSRVESGR